MNFLSSLTLFRVNKYCLLVFVFFVSLSSNLYAQRGYFDAPYKRYEADLATLSNGASATSKSYAQADLQSEASDQKCVTMSTGATLVWNVTESADGLVIRYSVPDGQSGSVGIYNGNTKLTSLSLTSNWSWESLYNNGNPNNGGIANKNPKMRFDEVRYKLPSKIASGGQLKIVTESGNVSIDFAELEPVPAPNTAPAGAAVYAGNGSDLQTFIDANGGKTVFVPTGVYNVSRELYIGANNTKLTGAGMWYTQLNFTNKSAYQGGLRADASGVSFSDLYLTTDNNSRSNSYKGINGVFTSTSVVKNIWAIHFECGAWIAQYNTNGPALTDGLLVTNCRFRNNYADGINFCKGTRNSIAEHCNFRNNGDDDQAMWSADGLECINNTFRNNTSENCWRASGVAIYGGKDNKAYDLIIKDNLEAGIQVNNFFPGVGFNTAGLHEFRNITISGCGTFNDIYNNRIAAVAISCRATAGTRVENVKLSNIDIIDSKDTAIAFTKVGGDGFYNFSLENININGTGKEFPNNNVNNLAYERGFFVAFLGTPSGNVSYCNMTYTNRGQNATKDIYTGEIGSLAWTPASGCGIIVNPPTQTPYAGVIQLPGTVEAENFDNGGEGIAYHDNEASNTLGAFRTEGVDIENCSEGGYNLAFSNNGEWTEYTVNVASTGSYNLTTRVASIIGGTFHIEMDGANVTGLLTAPNTGGWQNWVDVTKSVTLTAGQHIMRYFIDTKEFNTNKFVVSPVVVSNAQTPYAGVIQLPGTVEAENFDNGGQGIAYSDNDASNTFGIFRNEGVDIENCSEGGYNLAYSNNGEWTEYTVNVASTGSYNLVTRVASPLGGTFHIEMDGANVTGLLTAPNTGGWQNWVDVTKAVTLTAGQHIMRFFIDTKEFNTNRFVVTPATVVVTGNYVAIRNRWKGTYLYDAGANVGYGATVANNNYKWEKVITDTGYFYLKNLGTGEYMHVENQTGSVQCGPQNTGWLSSQWSQENIDATFVRLRNRWQTTQIIHVENQTGSAQYANASDGWWSAQWEFVPTTSTAKGVLEASIVAEASALSINIYPNPVTEKEFNLELSGLKNEELATVKVYDFNGRAVLNTKAGSSTKINHNFASGIYFISATADGQNTTKKLIVK
jgi:Carbohydrate binding module (family 6)/Secretion system C-terminal sorting domain/Right handed beta helix region